MHSALRRLAGALAVGFAASVPLALAGDDWKSDFNAKFSSRNSWDKANAIKKFLDPNVPECWKILMKVAREGDWYLRGAVVEALSKTKLLDKTLDEAKKLARAGNGPEAEVVIAAFGETRETAEFLEPVVEALKKGSDWHCRRAAAIALGLLPDKKGVGALVEAAEKEQKNFGVFVHTLESLEALTGQKNFLTALDWKGWWSGAEGTFRFPGEKKPKKPHAGTGDDKDDGDDAVDADAAEEAKSGEQVHTVSRGTSIDLRTRGKGLPLLVLPAYGFGRGYLDTYLRSLEALNQILYIDLPRIDSFSPRVANEPGTDTPMYPIDRLVESLEEMRKDLVKAKKLQDKPVAIMAHDMTAWVAFRYATKYPKSVGRLVLLGAYASNRQWSRGLKNMEELGRSRGDQELEHWAMWHSEDDQHKSRYTAVSTDDQRALDRSEFNIFVGNRQNLVFGRLLGPIVKHEGSPEREYASIRRMGGCYVPEFDAAKEPQLAVPTLVIAGDRSEYWGTPEDANEIARAHPIAKVQIFKGCSSLVMVEDTKTFIALMEKFLSK